MILRQSFSQSILFGGSASEPLSLERGVSASSSGLNLSWYTDSTQLGTPAVLKHSVPHQQTTLQHKLSQYCIKQPQLDPHH